MEGIEAKAGTGGFSVIPRTPGSEDPPAKSAGEDQFKEAYQVGLDTLMRVAKSGEGPVQVEAARELLHLGIPPDAPI